VTGGWRIGKRRKVARLLAEHARREGGAPPPDLLVRLRAEIPQQQGAAVTAHRPADASRGPRRWLLAASLTAAALTALAVLAGIPALVGVRVRRHLDERRLAAAAPPAGVAVSAPAAQRAAASPPKSTAVELFSPAVPPPPPPPSAAAAPRDVLRQAPAASPSAREAARYAGNGTNSGGVPKRRAAAGEGRPATDAGNAGDAGDAKMAAKVEAAKAGASPNALRSNQPPPPNLEAERVAGVAASTEPQGGQAAAAGPATASASPAAAAPALPAPAPRGAAEPRMMRAEAARKIAPAAGNAPSAAAAARPAALAGLPSMRGSFGAPGSTASYVAVRQELLYEGRLPRSDVQVEELANAFEQIPASPPGGAPAAMAEGAALPGRPGTLLIRFTIQGMPAPPSPRGAEVAFDPHMVASFRRVGASARAGGAVALFELDLTPAANAAFAAPAAGPEADPVIATLSLAGGQAVEAARASGAAIPPLLAVRLSSMRRSWQAASPALRLPGLAVQLGEALESRAAGRRWQDLRAAARRLDDEIPGDPRAAELLRLVERAADLASAPASGSPPS
jgi:hypothetical protein